LLVGVYRERFMLQVCFDLAATCTLASCIQGGGAIWFMNNDVSEGTSMYVVRKSQAERRATADRKLLTASYRIISESGITALTCEDVGRRAGYSRGQTYQRFGSKEGLLVAAVWHVSAERARFARSLHQRGANGVDRLIAHCRLHLDALAHQVKMRAFFRIASGPLPSMPDLETAVVAARQVYLDEITALLNQASADGSLRAGTDIRSAAATIRALLCGIALEGQSGGGPCTFPNSYGGAMEFLRRAYSSMTPGRGVDDDAVSRFHVPV
jgi:AcrR family transcriptional regulator